MNMAMALLEFSLLIMRIQLLGGRAFVLEHPLAATSWTHPWVQRSLAEFPQTVFSMFDFCMFGMVAKVCAVLPVLLLLLLGPVCCGHGPGGRDVSAAAPYSLNDRWARRDLSGARTRAHACTEEWLVSCVAAAKHFIQITSVQ